MTRYTGRRSVVYRSVATSASTIGTLRETLDAEIRFERENSALDAKMPEEITSFLREHGYSVQDKKGEAVVTLSTTKDGVSMRVVFDIRQIYTDTNRFEDEDDEDDTSAESDASQEGEEDDDVQPVSIRVELVKASDKLTFDAVLLPDSVNINSLHITPASMTASVGSGALFGMDIGASPEFTGPNYMDLSEDLQESFSDYLASLGIDSKLYDIVRNYMDFKEKKEYLDWLQKVKAFL